MWRPLMPFPACLSSERERERERERDEESRSFSPILHKTFRKLKLWGKTYRERPTSAHSSRFKRINFLNIQKDTFVRNSSILQCQKIPEKIHIRLANHFFPVGNNKKPILKTRIFFLWKKSHSAENPEDSSMLQNVLFLVKI